MSHLPPTTWPLVSVAILCYNADTFLPIFLPSILSLDYPNLEFIIVDDNSKDHTLSYLKKHCPQAKIIHNDQNKAFVGVANQLFWESKGKYFFLVNQDTVHSPDYLKLAVQKMESDPKIGVIGGKILKYDFALNQKTNLIDTTGQVIYSNRMVNDRGQGMVDEGQFEDSEEVFGISGQNPLYRREALLNIAIPIPGQEKPEVFDQDFYMYKEDIDISWRLRLFGWKAWYESTLIAWHGRGTVAVKRHGHWGIIKNRGKLSSFQKYYSIKNRYLLMLKNEFASEFFKNFLRIWWIDFLYFGYNLVFDPLVSIKSYFTLLFQIPAIWRKRQYLVKNRTISASEISCWFKTKQRI